MPPIVAAAIVTGIAGAGTAAMANRAQSSASRRATMASDRAAQRAEAFTREQDAQNRADEERAQAEDKRRWDIEQQNIAREKAERDARQSYEDTIRYGKMVKLARLTGMPVPERPNFTGAGGYSTPTITPSPSAPIMSRPSTANQMIARPGEAEPFAAGQRIPISNLVGRRRVI